MTKIFQSNIWRWTGNNFVICIIFFNESTYVQLFYSCIAILMIKLNLPSKNGVRKIHAKLITRNIQYNHHSMPQHEFKQKQLRFPDTDFGPANAKILKI